MAAWDNDPVLSAPTGNAWDKDPIINSASDDISAYDKYIKPLTPSGDLRGSVYGRVMQGMADPGAALFQMGANLTDAGDSVNKRIADVEKQYQASRAAQGSTGFDPLRMAGNVAITAPLAGTATVPALMGRAGLTGLSARVGAGAVEGAGFGALQPVTNGGDNFWTDKAKEAGVGAAAGGVMAPVAAGVSRFISPNASVNPQLQMLKNEGVNPTIGQALGGWANRVEEKMQSLPLLGDAITASRRGADDQLRKAAYARALEPIGEKTAEKGRGAVADIAAKLGDSYDKILPKLAADVTDPAFVSRISSLRQGVQSLPPDLRNYFDGVLSREIDGRVAPNGVLSGQNLKDAWNALRDAGKKLSNSPDAFQSDLGKAFKQAFEELKTHVTNSNNPALVDQLKKTDLGWANYKRIERAAAGLGADMGKFSPAQLQNAVSAMNGAAQRGQFARGGALMQDLSDAGKSTLSTKYPDSGTTGRTFLGALGLGAGAINPAIPLALLGGAGTYIPPVQRALVAAASSRPQGARRLADLLDDMSPMLVPAVVPAAEQLRNR